MLLWQRLVPVTKQLMLPPPPVESEVLTKENIANATLTQKRRYRTENLLKIATTVAIVAKKNSDFRKYVISEASKQIGGDYNVLIKTLLLHPEFGPLLKTPELLNGYNAFQNLEQENWEPQIYIPRLAAKENATYLNQTLSTDGESIPEFIIFDGNETTTSYPGYTLNSDDVLTPIPDLMIDSAYAENHEVWVLGLNEDENYGTYTVIQNFVPTSLPGVCNGPVTTGYFQHMKIKEHKESFVAGKSDVHIRRFSSWFHPESRNPFTNEVQGWYTFEKGTEREFQTPQGKVKQCVDEGNGVLIRKFSRSEVRNRANVEINWDYFKDWNGFCRSRLQPSYDVNCTARVNEISGNILYYVIFERDAWPSEKYAEIPNPAPGSNQIFPLKYRSEQSPYYWSYFRHSSPNENGVINNFRNTNVNHPSIEFTSRAK